MLRERRRHAHYKLNSRLDRKSSRGMIYENEELRLRTININAEVEKGQYDIKRLRRENEQLRREIWTLRDECDRLNKRFKSKIAEYEQNSSARGSGGSTSVSFLCNGIRYDAEHGICQSEDTDNCDLCKEIQKRNRKESYLQKSKSNARRSSQDQDRNSQISSCISNGKSSSKINGISLDQPFDHLSVVSEEVQSSIDVCSNRKKEEISSKTDQTISPTTPIEKFTTEYMDPHSIPPLSYFENINNRQSKEFSVSPTQIENENYSTQICEWEQNLKSPFPAAKKKLIVANSQETATDDKVQPMLKKTAIAVRSNENIVTSKSFNNLFADKMSVAPKIENNSKPSYTGVHPCSTFLQQPIFRRPSAQVDHTFRAKKQSFENHEPPDLCVTNGLATTFREQTENGKTSYNTPDTPSTSLSSNLKEVSAYFKDHQYYLRNSEEEETHLRKFLHYYNHFIHGITSFFDYKSIDFEKEFIHCNNVYSAKEEKYNILVQKQVTQKHIVVSKFLTLNNTYTSFNNVIFSKPIYVTATNACNILMTASTITKPLMMVSTFKSLASTFNYNKVPQPTSLTNNSPSYTKTLLFNNQIRYARQKFRNQLNTENLESLLNDIEMISEDICALRMQNNLLPDQCNLNTTETEQFDDGAATQFQNYEEKKKFRSEMNLLLSKNGINTTFLPVSTRTEDQFNSNDDRLDYRSTSLDKEYERTLLQSMPDPMRLFPENHHYQSKYEIHNNQNQSSLASPTDLSDTISARTLQSPINDLLPILRQADCQTVSTEKTQSNEATPLLPNKSQLYATVQSKAVRRKDNKSVLNAFNSMHNEMLPNSMLKTDSDFVDVETSRTATQKMLATASSWSDIPTHLNTKELKLFSFSTPNSPRSLRRNSKNKNSNINVDNTRRPSLHSQNDACLQVDTYHICQQVVSGDESNATCTRRHSDYATNNCQQSIKPSNGNAYCHLHRHHQHMHRTSIAKTRKDSNFDIDSPMSDRNSYSSPSRESSPSSNDLTRKISIASHKGGKIPWCGCWGNGCI